MQLDGDGYADLTSCTQFTPAGLDNGKLSVIKDHKEWAASGVGHYSLGDFMYDGYISVRNRAGVYWKRGKNFAEDEATGERPAHLKNVLIADSEVMGPSGPFTFLMENCTIYGASTVAAGQHCGLAYQNYFRIGSTCTVQYFLSRVNWAFWNLQKATNRKRVKFGVSGGNPMTPVSVHHSCSSMFSPMPFDCDCF